MKKLNKTIIFVVLALVPLLFSRCTLTDDLAKLKNSMDSVKIIIGTPEFKSLVHFDFVDAKTKQYITEVAVVNVTGKNASAVYSNLGQSTTTYSTMMGMLDLVLDPHQVDTTTILTNPLEFYVTTSLAGYVNVTQKVVFNENKIQTVTIPMIKISDKPLGVSVSEKTNFASSSPTGVLQATATETMNAGAQTVEIPKNVVLKDGAGNPVSGTVKSQIVFYDPTKSDAQAAIPGGLNVSAKKADGTTDNIQFVSAGMFGISLSAGDKEVKTFENGGIRIKTKLDPAMINPRTSEPIKEGDPIEMWSKDEGSGEWIFAKMDTVRKVGTDLVLEETVQHLSTWNWDFFTNACYLGPKIIFKGNVSSVTGSVTTDVFAWSFHKVDYFTAKPGDTNYGFIQMYRTPKNKPATIKFASTTPGVTFTPDSIKITDLCGGTYDVIISSTSSDVLTVMADLGLGSSSQPNLIIKPNATLMLKPTLGSTNWTINSVKNGIANLSIKLGTEYQIYAAYGTSSAMGKLRVDNAPNNMLVVTYTPTVNAGSTSQSVTLPPIPKPQNNTIVVKYNIVLPDNVFNLLQ